MNWLHRILATSCRPEPSAGQVRSQKPRLEFLEERALLSANPAILPHFGRPSVAVTLHPSAIVAGTDSSHVTNSHLLTMGHISMAVRHAIAK
jgi:hypothetical protein